MIIMYSTLNFSEKRHGRQDNFPNVFRKGRELWIDPDGTSPEKIARVIRSCPVQLIINNITILLIDTVGGLSLFCRYTRLKNQDIN